MTKKQQTELDKTIERFYYDYCREHPGTQIDVMKIGQVFEAGRKAHADGRGTITMRAEVWSAIDRLTGKTVFDTAETRGPVTEFGGINSFCDKPGCNTPADWRARGYATGNQYHGCNEHKTEIRDAAAVTEAAARHRAHDPHCTCNDCIQHHAQQMDATR